MRVNGQKHINRNYRLSAFSRDSFPADNGIRDNGLFSLLFYKLELFLKVKAPSEASVLTPFAESLEVRMGKCRPPVSFWRQYTLFKVKMSKGVFYLM